jgi:tetratricopeptide (TPR) repeat protein
MKIKILVLLSILTFSFNFCLAQQDVQKKVGRLFIVDSISNEIMNAPDSLMDALFVHIKRNRKKFKADYIPLLYEYANKSEAINYPKGQMQAFDRIGLQYRFDEVFDSALYYHNLSLDLALQLGDSTQLYYNYNNMGQVYRKQNINVLAINYFHKALKINEALGDTKAMSFTQNVLGAAYVVQKDYNKAMQYFRQSNILGKANNDKKTLAYNYGAMGEVFLLQNQIDSAMHYLIVAKQLKIEVGSNRGIPVADHLIGQALYAKNDIASSEKYFNLALTGHIKNHNKRYQSLCYAYLGKIDIRQNKFDNAKINLLKGEKMAESSHSLENLILINDVLFELYKKTGKWEKAIVSLQQSNIYQDSIMNIVNGQQLQSLEIEYETQKKEQRIELLFAENKIKNQRIRLGLAVISVLVLLVIMIFFLMRMRKKNAQIAEDDLKQKLFRSQMNPHFIFNALGSIQNYMYKNETKKAAQFLGNFASLSRSILKYSSVESISLEKEIETLTNYLELEQMRMKNAFAYEFITDQDLEKEFINIPPMMIQPFIENAIKHGLKDADKDGKITIEVNDKKDILEVIILDNGIGFINSQQNKDRDHESMATQIFNERMKHLKKKNRQLPGLSIQNISKGENTGTKIHLFLPIIK